MDYAAVYQEAKIDQTDQTETFLSEGGIIQKGKDASDWAARQVQKITQPASNVDTRQWAREMSEKAAKKSKEFGKGSDFASKVQRHADLQNSMATLSEVASGVRPLLGLVSQLLSFYGRPVTSEERRVVDVLRKAKALLEKSEWMGDNDPQLVKLNKIINNLKRNPTSVEIAAEMDWLLSNWGSEPDKKGRKKAPFGVGFPTPDSSGTYHPQKSTFPEDLWKRDGDSVRRQVGEHEKSGSFELPNPKPWERNSYVPGLRKEIKDLEYRLANEKDAEAKKKIKERIKEVEERISRAREAGMEQEFKPVAPWDPEQDGTPDRRLLYGRPRDFRTKPGQKPTKEYDLGYGQKYREAYEGELAEAVEGGLLESAELVEGLFSPDAKTRLAARELAAKASAASTKIRRSSIIAKDFKTFIGDAGLSKFGVEGGLGSMVGHVIDLGPAVAGVLTLVEKALSWYGKPTEEIEERAVEALRVVRYKLKDPGAYHAENLASMRMAVEAVVRDPNNLKAIETLEEHALIRRNKLGRPRKV